MLPEYISQAQIISSEGLESVKDSLHPSTEKYRELGRRYWGKMLEILQKNE